MDWFENWFDSKYYHILYENRNEEEAEIFLTNLTSLYYFKEKRDIIDIACGKGRHSLFLSKLGYNVTGIDLSNNSIMHAKKFEKENLRFKVADMREFLEKNSFDIALNLFTSFGYFEDKKEDQKVISSISYNLKENGILIIDFLNSKKTIRNLVKKELKIINDITFKISREFNNGFIHKNIEVNQNAKTYRFQEKIRSFSQKDFAELLTFAGMKIIDIFGDYKLNQFNQNTSDRLVIVAKK